MNTIKKCLWSLFSMLLPFVAWSQINANPDPNGPVWITGDCKSVEEGYFRDIPYLHLSDTSLNTPLPSRVQNDTSRYFPPIFDQRNVCCCTFASEVGCIFTYEMNRLRDVSAGLGWDIRQGVDTSDMHDLYHPLFGYNFKNHGYYKQFTNQADGFKLLQSVGCPMLNYYYNNCLQPSFSDSIKAMYWMSSYDGYANAIRQKVDSIYQIRFNPYNYSTFDTLKHWLYDHNEGEGSVGGLLSIAILTGGSDWARLPNNEPIYTQLGNVYGTGHVLTIVGYDDEICYDLNHNQRIDQDEYGAFKVANSWGTWLGTGFIWLPYKLMRDLQDHRRMAFCCTVKECKPTVYVKATWVHPHQYAQRNRFYPVLGTRTQSNMGMTDSESKVYPIFHLQGGYNALQGINDADSICIGFDYSCLFPDLDNAGKYFIRMHNSSNTTGNKIKNLSIVDYRWDEVFEMPCDSMEVSIDDSYTIIGLKYELLPFESPISSTITYNRELVARRTVNLTGNSAHVCFNNQTMVNMYGTDTYDSEIVVGEGATLQLADSVHVIAKRGDCRIIIRGMMTLGQGVTFEARDGATLEIIFNDNNDLAVSDATFINCDLVLPKKNVTFTDCHFKGTPLSITNSTEESYYIEKTASVIDCDFDANGRSIPNALFIKEYPHYIVSGCTIERTGDSLFTNGIFIKYCGSNTGLKSVNGNTIIGCSEAGLLMFASKGDVIMNNISGNKYGVKLMNDCNIGLFGGDCDAPYADSTQYIHGDASSEVYMTGSSVPATFKYNAIIGSGDDPFVYHDAYVVSGETPPLSRGPIDVRHNHWGPSFDPSTHLYTTLINGSYLYNPKWILGDCEDDMTEAYNALMSADSLNEAGQYVAARDAYKQVVAQYPSAVCAETALKTLLSLESDAGRDYESLQSYYLNDATIAADVTLSHLASSLANKCDEIMGNYSNAIAWYEEVLSNPSTSFNDSIFAAIDLGELYLRMDVEGEKGSYGNMVQYKPKSVFEFEKQTDDILTKLPQKDLNEKNSTEYFPIQNLELHVGNNDAVALTWNLPNGTDSNPMILSWLMNDSINDTMQAGYDSYMGHLYDSLDVRNFIGWTIESVSFYKVSNWSHVVYIWEQKQGESMHVLYSQAVPDETPFGLNTISFDEEIHVEPNTKYWFALRITYQDGGQGYTYPFGTVWNEDGVEGKSNLIMVPGFDTWQVIPYPRYHFWIKVCLVDAENDKRVLPSGKENQPLSGYRIYRDGTLIKEIPYSFVTYFTDTEFSRETDVEYCVTAVYGDEESEPVCATATITGIGETEADNGITVSPNPSSGLVRIEGAAVAEVKVYNALGQLMKTVLNSNEINLKGLPQGIYTIHITNEDGNRVIRKVVKE